MVKKIGSNLLLVEKLIGRKMLVRKNSWSREMLDRKQCLVKKQEQVALQEREETICLQV